MEFQSTPSTEGDEVLCYSTSAKKISIHALYGGRLINYLFISLCFFISIHALYGGRRRRDSTLNLIPYSFNPRPLRRATAVVIAGFGNFHDFNPRPLRRATAIFTNIIAIFCLILLKTTHYLNKKRI